MARADSARSSYAQAAGRITALFSHTCVIYFDFIVISPLSAFLGVCPSATVAFLQQGTGYETHNMLLSISLCAIE